MPSRPEGWASVSPRVTPSCQPPTHPFVQDSIPFLCVNFETPVTRFIFLASFDGVSAKTYMTCSPLTCLIDDISSSSFPLLQPQCASCCPSTSTRHLLAPEPLHRMLPQPKVLFPNMLSPYLSGSLSCLLQIFAEMSPLLADLPDHNCCHHLRHPLVSFLLYFSR